MLASLLLLATANAAAPRRVYLRITPLIGGPPALKLHSAVFVDSGIDDAVYGYDFIPRDPDAPATVARLLSLRSAPGEFRRLAAPDARGLLPLGDAAAEPADVERAALERRDDLHLVTNNCWAHSVAVAAAALGVDARASSRAIAAAVLRNEEEPPSPPRIVPPAERDPFAASLAEEKSRRYGAPLASFLSDEERLASARAAAAMEAALREAAGGDDDGD